MRIAQIAPLAERCPPSLYGGTERIVSYVTEELVRQGHDVTLFASGDSVTRAELVPCCDMALRLDPSVRDPLPYYGMMLDRVLARADSFDALHFHIDMVHFPLLRRVPVRAITTLHGRLDLPDLQPFYAHFPHFPLVSVSTAQRAPMPPVNWVGTVHHALPANLLRCCTHPRGDYLAFLGRISPQKRPDQAIEIAVRAGIPLKIAAKIDQVDRAYWESTIHPLVTAHANIVEYIGEIDERGKAAFLALMPSACLACRLGIGRANARRRSPAWKPACWRGRSGKRRLTAQGSGWSSRKLAVELGDVSHMTVARIWARHGIHPHR